MAYQVNNVTEDLKFLLTLTQLFETDEQYFWKEDGSDERFIYKLDATDEGKPIVLFQDPLPKGDHYFFNPYADGLGGRSPATQLYYKTVMAGYNVCLRQVIELVVGELVSAKTENDYALDPSIVRISAAVVEKKINLLDVADEKLVEEFSQLMDRINNNIVIVRYINNQTTASIKIDPLQDPLWDEKYGKDIRKKSLLAFKSIIRALLNIGDDNDVSAYKIKYDPALRTAAQFHTVLSVYLRLYSAINEFIAAAFGDSGEDKAASRVIDLGELTEVIDRSPMAYAIAKHMIQPALPATSATDLQSTDTSRMNFGAQPGKRRIPAAETIDAFGRPTGQPAKTLSMTPNMTGRSRFGAQVLSDSKVDPFAPIVAPALPMGMSAPMSAGFGMNPGGFYQQPSFGGGMGGFNMSPPSNFGSPAARKTYY